MTISILTLFPEMFEGPFNVSIIKRVQEKGHITIKYIQIRDFGVGNHKIVDDTPYGGGIGMVMRVDVVHAAILQAQEIFSERWNNSERKPTQSIILMTASGKPFKQPLAQHFSTIDHLIIICGHYEGVDDRIKSYIDAEISIGDFVLTGGEIPAMLITDAITRLLPGVLTEGATELESYSLIVNNQSLLEYPQYTRPSIYEGKNVPEVLLNGDHKKILAWRREEALKKTKHVRPELLTPSLSEIEKSR